MFEYHTSLHHSQTMKRMKLHEKGFEYHTSLHHSQTTVGLLCPGFGLSTILLYIILKPLPTSLKAVYSLSTILLYIILKHTGTKDCRLRSLSTILLYIILKPR